MNRRRNKRRSSFVHHQLAKCVKNNDPQQCSRQQLPHQQKPQHPQQHQLKSMPLRNEGALHQYVKLLSAEGLIEESTSTSSVKRSKLETTRHYNQCLPQFNMKTSQSSYESPPGSSTSVSFLNNLVHFTQHNLDTYVATASSLHNMPHTPLGSVKQPRNNQICTSSIHQRRPFSSTENPIVWTPPSSSSSSSSSSSTSSSSSSSSSSSPNAKSSSATFNKKCCCGIPMLGRATRKRSSLDIDIVSASHSLSSNMCIDITHMCLSWAHAATLGCSSSQFNLAKCFAMGHGVRADARQAFKLYTLAASHGYAPASYQLGMSYKLGVGVKRDNNLALHHFREAARVGVVRANYEVALYYEQRGELSQAIHHYGIAAKTGHIADAQYALARCYEDGIGTFQNRIEAMHWYNLAAAQGHRMAQISSLNTMLTTPNNTLPNSMDYRAQHDLNTNRTASLSLTSSSLSSLQVQENDYDDDDDDDDDIDDDDDDDTDNNDKVRASNKSDDTTTEPLVRPDTLINDVERITINQHTEPLQKVQKTQCYNNDIQFVQN